MAHDHRQPKQGQYCNALHKAWEDWQDARRQAFNSGKEYAVNDYEPRHDASLEQVLEAIDLLKAKL